MPEGRFIHLPPELLEKKNVVLSAPTGSGKTTTALEAIKELVIRRRRFSKALYLTPTIALADEVYHKLVRDIGERMVGIVTSDAKLEPGYNYRLEIMKPIVVAPYEVGDSLLYRSPSLFNNGIVAVDEIHNITSHGRVTVLKSILANIKYLVKEKGYRIRTLVMSATIPEVKRLVEYLDAELITHNVRPVELVVERMRIGSYYSYRAYVEAKISALKRWLRDLESRGLSLARRAGVTVNYDPGDNMDKRLTAIRMALRSGLQRISDESLRSEIEDYLDRFPIYVFIPNRKLIERLAAELGGRFHHRGVPPRVKREIQEELRKKDTSFSLLFATHTLLQGVNMSVGTVVVTVMRYGGITIGTKYLTPEEVKQLIGRAGRPNLSRKGYAMIIETPRESEIVDRALYNEFSSIPVTVDYPMLAVYLVASGRDPEIWAKYALDVDSYALYSSMNALRRLGIIAGEKEPTALAHSIVSAHVDSATVFGAAAASLLEQRLGPRASTPLKRALGYVLLAGSIPAGLYNAGKSAPGILLDGRANVLYDAAYELETWVRGFNELDELGFDTYDNGSMYSLGEPADTLMELLKRAGFVGVPWIGIEAPELIYLSNPGAFNSSYAYEALRNIASWLASAAGAEPAPDATYPVKIPPELGPYFEALAKVFTGIRVIAKNLGGGLENEATNRVLLELEDIAELLVKKKLKLKKTDLRDAYIAVRSGTHKRIAEFLEELASKRRERNIVWARGFAPNRYGLSTRM